MVRARRVAFASALISLPLAHLPAQSPEVMRLAPADKWVLDYADEDCSLGRKFGSGENEIFLLLHQSVPGDTFRVVLAGEALHFKRLKKNVKGKIRFGSNPSNETDGFSAKLGKLPAYLATGSQRIVPLNEQQVALIRTHGVDHPSARIPPASAESEQAATTVEIADIIADKILTLETGPMREPLSALKECSWDTVRSWGFDVAQQKGLSRKPYPTNAGQGWFRPEDYPTNMLRDSRQAIVNYRVIVDESGNPSDCKIQRSTRPKAFDDVVCKIILTRAKFEPALDASGKPVKSYAAQTITWRLQ